MTAGVGPSFVMPPTTGDRQRPHSDRLWSTTVRSALGRAHDRGFAPPCSTLRLIPNVSNLCHLYITYVTVLCYEHGKQQRRCNRHGRRTGAAIEEGHHPNV